ncbi:MAG: hypothetical protein EKK41_09945 [Hyphomicrobiales bacterium]|nr:MAG: hypothetical protein EKK41_09945 [Hyphomicrobiales bacterium]
MQFSSRMQSQVALMSGMMRRIGVTRERMVVEDGGLAWMTARTKCIFCSTSDICRAQLESAEFSLTPKSFCPNAKFFYSSLSQILREEGVQATD